MVVSGIDTPLYLVRNNEDQTWNGIIWSRFPFEIDNIDIANGKETPAVSLKITNAGGLIQSYIQNYTGFCDAAVSIYVVHARNLANPTPEVEMDFVVTKISYAEDWVTFTLGASNDQRYRFPLSRYLTNYCDYHFKSIRCGYAGSLTACDGTITTCRIPKRFGGEQGISTGS